MLELQQQLGNVAISSDIQQSLSHINQIELENTQLKKQIDTLSNNELSRQLKRKVCLNYYKLFLYYVFS